ncbi:MAG: hypothetical protein IKO57_08260 [Treponema sp.]|nr:hypothetical protein [Treponema sp.]MBR4630417.1 hypothetical protein [Treponema sp.]
MNAIAQQTANWYVQMLMPLENSIKITIINKLSASILEKDDSAKEDMSFFNDLNNSWCDDISPEEEADSIRASRTQGKTRILEEF